MARLLCRFLLRWIAVAVNRLGRSLSALWSVWPGGKLYPRRLVESVYDGDTLRFTPPIGTGVSLRFLNIDTPELGGDTQEPWARNARDSLRELVPVGSQIKIRTAEEPFDQYGRVLGHVFRSADNLHLNLEQVRMGHAATYFIWPNVAHFARFRNAQREAQRAGRGIWAPERPLREMPFEYRLRKQKRVPDKYVGDWLTRLYYTPADYAKVDINDRIFFLTEEDARAAGYRKWNEGGCMAREGQQPVSSEG